MLFPIRQPTLLILLLFLFFGSYAAAALCWQRTLSPLAPAHSFARPNKATPQAVLEAVARVFGQAVAIDETAAPTFLQGDFNGDGARDLAVVVKPNPAMLTALNDPLANWITEDPAKAVLLDPTKRVQKLPVKPPRPMVTKDDVLLAIVHGYGPDGWRNPQARQAYLLRNSNATNLTRLPGGKVPRSRDRRFPTLHGDVIHEVLQGQAGFLYWAGGQYAFRAENK